MTVNFRFYNQSYRNENQDFSSVDHSQILEKLATLPIIVFTAVVQRHLVRGLTFGAVKG